MIEEKLKEIFSKLTGISQWQTDHEINEADRISKLPDIVKNAVEVKINGDLRKIRSHLEGQDVVLGEIREELGEVREEQTRVRDNFERLKNDTEPIVETTITLKSVRRFLLWIATPFAILWAAWQYIINQIK